MKGLGLGERPGAIAEALPSWGGGQAGLSLGAGTQTGGSGPSLQGPQVHAGQAEPGRRQLLAGAALVETDVQEEVASVEEEEGPKAGGLARRLHLWGREKRVSSEQEPRAARRP